MTKLPPAIHKMNHTDSAAIFYYFMRRAVREGLDMKDVYQKKPQCKF